MLFGIYGSFVADVGCSNRVESQETSQDNEVLDICKWDVVQVNRGQSLLLSVNVWCCNLDFFYNFF